MKSLCLIKIIPEKLPKPLLEPTRPVRIDFPGSHSVNPTNVLETFGETHEKDQKPRRSQIHWDDAKDAVVVEMIHNGETHRAIADQLGVSASAVHKRVQRLRRKGADI